MQQTWQYRVSYCIRSHLTTTQSTATEHQLTYFLLQYITLENSALAYIGFPVAIDFESMATGTPNHSVLEPISHIHPWNTLKCIECFTVKQSTEAEAPQQTGSLNDFCGISSGAGRFLWRNTMPNQCQKMNFAQMSLFPLVLDPPSFIKQNTRG